LGAVLVAQEKFAEAEKVARQGLALDPTAWSGQYSLGWALFGLNRVDEAEKSAREAVRLNATSLEAFRLLADVHSRQRNYRALLNDLDAYLKLDSDSPASVRVRSIRATAQRLLDAQNSTVLAQTQP
jgi:tetratricopeptide (TPR) repeat protein